MVRLILIFYLFFNLTLISNSFADDYKFSDLKKGTEVQGKIVLSNKLKIPLPEGNWQVVKKGNIEAWHKAKYLILTKDKSTNEEMLEEFIEINVSSINVDKHYVDIMGAFRKPCKKKYYFHTIQKSQGSGNSFNCFATGYAENNIFQQQKTAFMPWNYKFRDYFSKENKLQKKIFFSLNAYAAKKTTNKKFFSVFYGSLVNNNNFNQLDEQNKKLIKDTWTKKTINFYQDFQKDMNIDKTLLTNLDDEYQSIENQKASLTKTKDKKKIVKKEKKFITKKKVSESDNESKSKDTDIQQEDKNIKIVRNKVSDDKAIVNLDAPGSKFFKLSVGDTINNNIIEINKNKIPLPDGNWRVVKSKNPSVWGKAKTYILTNESSANNLLLEEFIEITVTSTREKAYLDNMAQFKKPCKKKYNFQTIQKNAGGGQSYSCFVSGIYFSSGFQRTPGSFMPWYYAYRDYFSKLPNKLLFSLSGYASPKYTRNNFIAVMYGSSINNIIKSEELNIANENNLNEKSEKLIRNIWRKKTINFHNNFQNAMNFGGSHFVSLEDDYNLAEKLIADLSTTGLQKQKVKKIIKKEKKAKEKLVADKEVSEEQKKIAKKKAKAEKKKKLAEKKIKEEEKKLAEKKAKEEAENQKILSSTNIDTEITSDENSSNNKNFLKALAKKEVLEYNKKKIIRYECQQPWDLTTEDYRPLLDIYELDLVDRVLIGTHRYITDKEYTEERTYPILAKDKDRVLVRYDSPNGNFSTKFFFNYGTDQSIVAVDNSYKTQARCVNRDYFVDIKVAKKKVDNLELSKKDLKALEEAKNEALLAEKEIKEIEKEQEKLLAKQEKILKKQKQGTETTKVAKLKIYDDPKKLNKSFSSSVSKSMFKKYNATSTVSYLFFESSENYLISLELLYRAYDLNTEAEKIRSHISYMKESKSSENQRLKSTRQIVQSQSATISNNIRNDSIELTEQGRVYYAQSLPYALNAAIATYNLYHVAINTVNNVGQSGDIVFGILNNLNNVIGIAQILPEIPSYSKNMYKTTKLIITGAKTKKIKESRSTKKALDDLNLEIS